MKNQTNRIMRKKKIFECFLSIHKSIGNVLISNTKKDKMKHKYEMLRKKVISNNEKYSLKEKSNYRETTLNNIFKRNNNLCTSQNNEENKINNLSRIHKSKFAEKYNELYNITTNGNSKMKNREKNNSVSYLSNKLKSMNNVYNYNEKVKTYIYNNDYNLKRTFNNLNNDIFTLDLHRNCDNRYLSQTNLTNNINNRNYNSNIRKKLLNSKIDGIKNVLKSMDKIKMETNKNILVNNYINNPNIINNNVTRKKNNKNYFNISKSIKTNGCYPSYDKNSNYNDLKSNLFTTNNLSLVGNDEKERIIHKINHFKVRLNLISMK